MRYIFKNIEKCNFCGQAASKNRVLGQRLNKSFSSDAIGISVSIQRCGNCDLIYSNPQPIPENIQDHYGIPADDYWKEEYFKYDPSYFSEQIRTAKYLIEGSHGKTALDIGAGIGKCMLSLTNAGFDAYGIEPSETFREKAIMKMKIDENRLKFGMIEDVDFELESFDFITFGAVLEHLYSPAEVIERTLKWLKPNGVIQIEVPSSNWFIASLINMIYRFKGTSFVTNLSPMHEPYHMYEFTLKSFQKLATKLNFEVAEHQYHVCDIYHVPKVIHPLLKWYMNKTNKGMQLTVWLKKPNAK